MLLFSQAFLLSKEKTKIMSREETEWPVSYETIDLERLRKLRVYNLPRTYELQRGMGNGCSGDAPGFPTYFTKSVYTQHGNSPRSGAELVIQNPETGILHVIRHTDDATYYAKRGGWDAQYAAEKRRLRK